jgi:hypothetical protein
MNNISYPRCSWWLQRNVKTITFCIIMLFGHLFSWQVVIDSKLSYIILNFQNESTKTTFFVGSAYNRSPPWGCHMGVRPDMWDQG